MDARTFERAKERKQKEKEKEKERQAQEQRSSEMEMLKEIVEDHKISKSFSEPRASPSGGNRHRDIRENRLSQSTDYPSPMPSPDYEYYRGWRRR